MKLCLILVLTLPLTAIAQTDNRPKPIAPQSTIQREVILDPLKKPIPNQIVLWGVRPPVQRVQFRPEGIVGGLRVPSSPPPRTLKQFIEMEIRRIHTRCTLTAPQMKKLGLAGKGVLHRVRQRTKPTGNNELVFLGDMPVLGMGLAVPDQTPQFRKQLSESKLWTRTLERTLTTEQRKLLDAKSYGWLKKTRGN